MVLEIVALWVCLAQKLSHHFTTASIALLVFSSPSQLGEGTSRAAVPQPKPLKAPLGSLVFLIDLQQMQPSLCRCGGEQGSGHGILGNTDPLQGCNPILGCPGRSKRSRNRFLLGSFPLSGVVRDMLALLLGAGGERQMQGLHLPTKLQCYSPNQYSFTAFPPCPLHAVSCLSYVNHTYAIMSLQGHFFYIK